MAGLLSIDVPNATGLPSLVHSWLPPFLLQVLFRLFLTSDYGTQGYRQTDLLLSMFSAFKVVTTEIAVFCDVTKVVR
jgi:hypothetical protein